MIFQNELKLFDVFGYIHIANKQTKMFEMILRNNGIDRFQKKIVTLQMPKKKCSFYFMKKSFPTSMNNETKI